MSKLNIAHEFRVERESFMIIMYKNHGFDIIYSSIGFGISCGIKDSYKKLGEKHANYNYVIGENNIKIHCDDYDKNSINHNEIKKLIKYLEYANKFDNFLEFINTIIVEII